MNFDELEKNYMYSYKKYSADDIYKLELIKYLQEAQNNYIIIKPKKKKCKFLKCYCKLKNNILKLNRDKNCLT